MKISPLLFLLVLGIIVVMMPNGTEIQIPFNDTMVPPQKSCVMPPKNPNTNFSLAPEGCP